MLMLDGQPGGSRRAPLGRREAVKKAIMSALLLLLVMRTMAHRLRAVRRSTQIFVLGEREGGAFLRTQQRMDDEWMRAPWCLG